MRDGSIALWKLFSDLDLSEARKTHFRSLHDCFTRELKPGLRPFDPDPSIVASPSDGIVGAHGRIADTELFQVKGAPYSLLDLLGDSVLVDQHRNGSFVTLRLTSSMYHRFHAPYDAHIERVTLIHGDVWNVNPIALKRVERLFCKNERAVIRTHLSTGEAGDAGAGRRDPGGKHPPALPRHGAECAGQGAGQFSLRRQREQGRGARLVRARLDHHHSRARRFHLLRRHRRRHAHSRRSSVAEKKLAFNPPRRPLISSVGTFLRRRIG
ncbi:hypothetical protein ACVWXM_005917 [Bradyrhizobium sp. GM7.3]